MFLYFPPCTPYTRCHSFLEGQEGSDDKDEPQPDADDDQPSKEETDDDKIDGDDDDEVQQKDSNKTEDATEQPNEEDDEQIDDNLDMGEMSGQCLICVNRQLFKCMHFYILDTSPDWVFY